VFEACAREFDAVVVVQKPVIWEHAAVQHLLVVGDGPGEVERVERRLVGDNRVGVEAADDAAQVVVDGAGRETLVEHEMGGVALGLDCEAHVVPCGVGSQLV
jgi:hypothetical protein